MSDRDNRLLELRTSKGLAQTVVGDFVNLSQTQVSAYERGRIIPSDVLICFAQYYGVTTDYILMLSDDKYGDAYKDANSLERKLMMFYRQLSNEGKAVVDAMVRGYDPIQIADLPKSVLAMKINRNSFQFPRGKQKKKSCSTKQSRLV